jgi:hypothetical protein
VAPQTQKLSLDEEVVVAISVEKVPDVIMDLPTGKVHRPGIVIPLLAIRIDGVTTTDA